MVCRQEGASLDSQPDLDECCSAGGNICRHDRHLHSGWWHSRSTSKGNSTPFRCCSIRRVGKQALDSYLLCMGSNSRLAGNPIATWKIAVNVRPRQPPLRLHGFSVSWTGTNARLGPRQSRRAASVTSQSAGLSADRGRRPVPGRGARRCRCPTPHLAA